jgi:hypothetical protein
LSSRGRGGPGPDQSSHACRDWDGGHPVAPNQGCSTSAMGRGPWTCSTGHRLGRPAAVRIPVIPDTCSGRKRTRFRPKADKPEGHSMPMVCVRLSSGPTRAEPLDRLRRGSRARRGTTVAQARAHGTGAKAPHFGVTSELLRIAGLLVARLTSAHRRTLPRDAVGGLADAAQNSVGSLVLML